MQTTLTKLALICSVILSIYAIAHAQQGGSFFHLYSATSTDGLNWTHDGVMLLDHASVPCAIVLKDGRVRLYYVDASTAPEGTNCAESTDGGRSFRPLGCKIEKKSSYKALDPSIVQLKDRRFRLYAFNQRGNQSIGSFISTDGINWTQEPGVRLTAPVGKEITDPFVVRLLDGTWKMFFKISAENRPPSN